MDWLRREWALGVVLLLAVPILFGGLGWGLPSRETDRFLFGDRVPWTGAEITALAGGWSDREKQGADVQRDAALDRSRPVELNASDAKRAEIVRRYRLFTDQPDEMINLRAFSQMRPGEGRFDPRLYQYGGVWFYPGGVLLKMAEKVGYVRLRGDVTYYMDDPEEVGRIYVVLRMMSAVWGLLGVVGVYGLVRQMGLRSGMSGMVGLGFALMPGVVVFGHEAKPHLAGVVLVLWSAVAGVEYVKRGGWGWLVGSGVAAGSAFGVVVSMMPAVLVPLSAVAIRNWGERRDWGRGMGVIALFIGVYGLTNPYVIWHLLTDRSVLTGQVGNSTAMYGLSLGGVVTGLAMLVLSGPGVMAIPVAGVMAWRGRRWPVVFGVLGPTVGVVAVIFLGLGSGKPGEFARFGLLVGAFGLIAVGYVGARLIRGETIVLLVLGVSGLISGPEWWGYVQDGRGEKSRLENAEEMDRLRLEEVWMRAEPGPYNTPALDLWKTRWMLLPEGEGVSPEGVTLVQPPWADGYLRMSWVGRRAALKGVDISSGESKP